MITVAIQRAIRCNASDPDIRDISDHSDRTVLSTYTLHARSEGQVEKVEHCLDIDPWLLHWPFRSLRRQRDQGDAILNTRENAKESLARNKRLERLLSVSLGAKLMIGAAAHYRFSM